MKLSLQTINNNALQEILKYIDTKEMFTLRKMSKTMKENIEDDGNLKMNIGFRFDDQIYSPTCLQFSQIGQIPQGSTLQFIQSFVNTTKKQIEGKKIQSIEDPDDNDNLSILELEGVESSSHDFNQTIHCTLYKYNMNIFWSSTGSETPQESEYLIYKVSKEAALISSIGANIYMATIQHNDPQYPPKQIQFHIGFKKGHYHFSSQVFDFKDSLDHQRFYCLPSIVVGRYIKIDLIGKPNSQDGDDKYYIAMRYIEVLGVVLSKIKSPLVQNTLKKVESKAKEDYDKMKQENKDKSKSVKELSAEEVLERVLEISGDVDEDIEEAYKFLDQHKKNITQSHRVVKELVNNGSNMVMDYLLYTQQKVGVLDKYNSIIFYLALLYFTKEQFEKCIHKLVTERQMISEVLRPNKNKQLLKQVLQREEITDTLKMTLLVKALAMIPEAVDFDLEGIISLELFNPQAFVLQFQHYITIQRNLYMQYVDYKQYAEIFNRQIDVYTMKDVIEYAAKFPQETPIGLLHTAMLPGYQINLKKHEEEQESHSSLYS